MHVDAYIEASYNSRPVSLPIVLDTDTHISSCICVVYLHHLTVNSDTSANGVSVCAGSGHREGQNLPPRDSPSSHRLQHSHSDLSPHHSLDSASMSPLFDHQPQQHSQTGVSQSRHSRSVTADQLGWPRGSNLGQDGGGGRRGDWGGMNAVVGSEPDLLARQLRVDVISPVSSCTGNCVN